MRRTLLTILLALAPAAVAQQPVTPAPQLLPRDVRQTVVERWNGSAEFRASDRAEIGATSEVRGNVAVLRGPLVIAGRVIGSVLVINGDVILRRLGEATSCEPLLDGVTPLAEVAAFRRGDGE